MFPNISVKSWFTIFFTMTT